MMQRDGSQRKRKFMAALRLAGLSVERWRTEVYPVSRQHLDEVFKGNRKPSAELDAAINGVIAEWLPRGVKESAA